MSHHEHDDREIRELFARARLDDRQQAPDFANLTTGRRRPERRRLWVPALALVVPTVALAVFAVNWLQAPEEAVAPQSVVELAPPPEFQLYGPLNEEVSTANRLVAPTAEVEKTIGGKEAAPPESKPESKQNRKMKVAKSLETPPAVTATGQLAAQRLTTFEAEVSRLRAESIAVDSNRTVHALDSFAQAANGRAGVAAAEQQVLEDTFPDGPLLAREAPPARLQPSRFSANLNLPGEDLDAEASTESYAFIEESGFRSVADHPLSTFAIDVDTASYANVRRFLQKGQLPPKDAVRVEELINYFSYDYPEPQGTDPFSVSVEVADCPWNMNHRLARIGLKGRRSERAELKGSNLVFLLDVSGSMRPPNKLPLLQSALQLLVDQLDGRDQVAIVVYAGASGVVLPSTSGAAAGEIRAALQRLEAGGSTNGGEGLRAAYRIARENFIPGGVNRVILATDGDFNVGVTGKSELLSIVEQDAKRGIFLTVLGVGGGNYKGDRLETLANRANGNYAYIDALQEAQRVLVDQIGATLVTIAKDVKIQVEFNPAEVGSYRLIGYENRLLAKEDFNDDSKDGGEIGAGRTVTALYELAPPGESRVRPPVDALKYQTETKTSEASESGELLTVKLRYKEPEGDASRRLSVPIVDSGYALESASADFKLAAAAAAYGMLLRKSPHVATADLGLLRDLAYEGLGPDKDGYRMEFLGLFETARQLDDERRTTD